MAPTLTLPGNGVPQELAGRIKSSLSGFMHQTVRPVNDVDKVYWNNKLRRNDLYYRGMQYLTYGYNGSGFADYVNIGNQNSTGIRAWSNNQDSLYDYVLNFYQGDVDTFVAIIGARAPNCQSEAKDPSNDAHVRMKMKADRVAQWLQSSWNLELLQPLLVKGLALFGTMFSYTRFTVNPRKYGVTQAQQFSLQETPVGPAYFQCWNCGTETPMDQAQSLIGQVPNMPPDHVPCSKCGTPLGPESLIQPQTIPSLVPNDVAPLANGAVELSIYHSSHITTDLKGKDLDYVPFLMCESEEDKGALVQAYPELRPKIYAQYSLGSDETQAMGAYTRALLKSPTATIIDPNRNRWLHTLTWIAPSAYEYLPSDRSGELRDFLTQTYPDGLKVPMVNGEVLVDRLENERLTSVWACCKPKPTEGIYCDPYFDCMIQVADSINDGNNMTREQMERSNPFVIADPELLNPDMLREFNNVPGEFKFAKPGSGGMLEKAFFRVPAAELNPVLITYIDKQLAWVREITGINPALFGGPDEGGEKTAREVEIRRNQAMQKLGLPWSQIRMFWAATYENGIYQAAKYSGETMFQRSPRGNVESMRMEGIWELLGGGWYMHAEESTPMTIGQRRDFVMHLLTGTNPDVQGAMGIRDPDNIVKIQEAVGMSDWIVPGYQQVIGLHDVINQLVNGQPLPGPPGPPDPMSGMPGPPGPPQPSIPFDPFLFDPPLAIQVVKNWLLSGKGMGVQVENPAGYQNVLAYGHAIAGQIPPPPPPEQKAPSLSVSVAFDQLTPDAQQAVFHQFGIQAPPGVLATPKLKGPVGRPMGELPPGGGGPPMPPMDDQQPDNSLASVPSGNEGLAEPAPEPPPAALAAPPPG